MVQANFDPVGSFTQSFAQGFGMAQQKAERKMREKTSMMQNALNFASKDYLPEEDRLRYFNSAGEIFSEINGTKHTPVTSLPENASMKQLNKILDDKEMSWKQKIEATKKWGIQYDIGVNKIESFTKGMEKKVRGEELRAVGPPTPAGIEPRTELGEEVFEKGGMLGMKAYEEEGLKGLKGMGEKVSTPTNLAKLIKERADLKASGVPDDDPRIKAYDSQISGADIDIEGLTEEEIKVFGVVLATTGKMINVGRGKAASKVRIAIAKSAAAYALKDDPDAPPDMPDKTPIEAALSIVGEQADTKAIQTSLNFLDKQMSAMGSFVTNMESQVNQVKALAKDLKTFDIRLLNIPLRALRKRIIGSPLQAKYEMYLTEIEGEIGKLATGSAASIAELSIGAQEKWDKIHDKNLSVKDMVSLLEETVHAGKLRIDSVIKERDKASGRMRRKKTGIPQVTSDKGGLTAAEAAELAELEREFGGQ